MFAVRSAVLVDYDNVAPFFPNYAFSGRISNWLSWLEDGRFDPLGRKRRFVAKKVYWHKVFSNEKPAFEQFGFTAKTCVYAAGSKQGQSAVDLHLALDAVDLLNRHRSLREVIILASDSDYVPVIERLQEKGLRTGIVYSARDASAIYKGKAEFVIAENDLGEALSYVRSKGRRQPVAEAGESAPGRGMGAHSLLDSGAKRKRPRPSTEPKTDLDKVAEAVVGLARSQPGLTVGKDRIIAALKGFWDFKSDGASRWFGANSYEQLLREIVRRRPELSIQEYPNKGIAVFLPKAGVAKA